jgi:hypothetical protein
MNLAANWHLLLLIALVSTLSFVILNNLSDRLKK